MEKTPIICLLKREKETSKMCIYNQKMKYLCCTFTTFTLWYIQNYNNEARILYSSNSCSLDVDEVVNCCWPFPVESSCVGIGTPTGCGYRWTGILVGCVVVASIDPFVGGLKPNPVALQARWCPKVDSCGIIGPIIPYLLPCISDMRIFRQIGVY